jgi:GNAT superfamily N-acetyltransferase
MMAITTASQICDLSQGRIRRLWPSDAAAYRAHLLRLEPEARYSRFCTVAADKIVVQHVNTCFGGDTLVFGFFVDGKIRGAAELHLLVSATALRAREAETAFSVEKAWRHSGLGSALIERLILAASSRGLRSLLLSCLPQNFAMQSLAKKYGATFAYEADEMSGKIKVRLPTAQTIFTEFVEESCDFATALFDLQKQIFPSIVPVGRAA